MSIDNNDNNFGDSSANSTFTLEDFGLDFGSDSGLGDKGRDSSGGSSVGDLLNGSRSSGQHDLDAESLDKAKKILEAAKKQDLRTLLDTAGFDSGAAMASIPSLAVDKNVAELQNKIKELEGELGGTSSWIKEQQSLASKRDSQQKQQQQRERLKAMIQGRDSYLEKLDRMDLVENSVKEFAQHYKRMPNQQEIMRLAAYAEKSLREEARQTFKTLGLDNVAIDELDVDSFIAGKSDVLPQSRQNVTDKGVSRPTLNNGSVVHTAQDKPVTQMSDQERVQRGIEALIKAGF